MRRGKVDREIGVGRQQCLDSEEDYEAPSCKNTGAVIIAYFPAANFLSRVKDISTQALAVLIVDNTPGVSQLANLCNDLPPNVTVASNGCNRGIAAALNQGIAWAQGAGCKWLLTLDQDSSVYKNLIDVHAKVFRQLAGRNLVAVIGSNYECPDRTKRLIPENRFDGQDWIQMSVAITSGSLLSLAAVQKLGPFCESLFIDHVDTEYCLRARGNGYTIVITREPVMSHAIGKLEATNLMGRPVSFYRHSPLRWYYRTRNLVMVSRSYFISSPRYLLASYVYFVRFIATMLLLDENRWSILRSIVAGVIDGIQMPTVKRGVVW